MVVTSWDIFRLLFVLFCYAVGRCDERDDSYLGLVIVAVGTMAVWFLWRNLF